MHEHGHAYDGHTHDGPFSGRSDRGSELNAFSRALAERRLSGAPLLDVSVTNPTAVGLPYDHERIAAALAEGARAAYSPEPLGLLSARQVIADRRAAEGLFLSAEQVMLTASTSESYAHVFRLLCDPGDEVLVPEPSYPLLAELALQANVTLSGYPLEYDGRWRAEPSALYEAIGPRTKAIVVISPNNPTGHYATRDDLEAYGSFDLPLIADEVFYEHPLEAPADRARAASLEGTLVFAMDGLSKTACLPQMKLAWTTVTGPGAAAALDRLEHLSDAYLSAAGPVQHALGALLEASQVTRDALSKRCQTNLKVLREALEGTAMSVPRVEGGWVAPIRMPTTKTDEEWALHMLELGVRIQPGYFYDFAPSKSWIVASLMSDEEALAGSVAALKTQ